HIAKSQLPPPLIRRESYCRLAKASMAANEAVIVGGCYHGDCKIECWGTPMTGPKWPLFLVLAASSASVGALAAERKGDYGRDIRRTVADKCFACHGHDAKQRQAGLRLDSRDEATKALESGERAIVPGDTAASALVSRIFAADESERMPPAEFKKTLTAE